MKAFREWWKRFCDEFLLWLIIGFMVISFVGGIYGAVMLIIHRGDRDYDEEYDEYLEEQYDSMERYDPV